MDENVVFNPPKSDDPNAGAAPPPDGQTPADPNAVTPAADTTVPADPNAAPAAEGAVPADPAAEETAADGATEEATDGSEELVAEEEPQSFFKSPLFKKLLIGLGILILIIVLVLILIPRNQGDEKVKLLWWGLWEESSAIQAVILDFEAKNPNIDVEYVKRDKADYRERLVARSENESGPDIFRYHNSWLPMLKDQLVPLSSDVIAPDQFKQAYYPVMQKDLVQNGAIYGLPLMVDSLALFVNPEIFEAAGTQVPTNWDDFVKVSKEMTVLDSDGKIKTAGAALGTYKNVKHASDIISLLFVQQGVDMENLTASTTNQTDALEFYLSFAQGKEKVWDTTLDNSMVAFSKGNLAMYFGYSWDVFEIQKLNKNMQFNIYPAPELYGKKTTIASYWVEGVSAKSPNKEAAFTFLNYLSQKETAEKFYSETAKSRSFGELYPRKDMRENLREVPLAYPFVQQLDDASKTYFASDTHDGDTGLNTQLNTYLEKAFVAATEESESLDRVMKSFTSGTTEVLTQYGLQQQQ